MEHIFYLGGYVSEEVQYRKPAAGYNASSNKMKYIVSLLKNAGNRVTIIAYYHGTISGINRKIISKVDDYEVRWFLPSIDILSGPFKKITGITSKLSILFTLCKLPKHAHILVYNFNGYAGLVKLVNHFKHFEISLDIEEIQYYYKQGEQREREKHIEENMFALASRYITVNDLIYDRFLANDKPYMVLYGNYSVQSKKAEKINDGRIHVLFSGSIDRIRGADRAVKAARFLPDNYCIHLTGGGQARVIKEIEQEAKDINVHAGYEKVILHGQLPLDKLDVVVQSMHIGLNLQDVENPFEAVSFPSKIAFYFSHGLNVVSSRMTSVLASSLSNKVSFYEGNAPIEIAKAIMNTQITSFEDNTSILQELDRKAKKDTERVFASCKSVYHKEKIRKK